MGYYRQKFISIGFGKIINILSVPHPCTSLVRGWCCREDGGSHPLEGRMSKEPLGDRVMADTFFSSFLYFLNFQPSQKTLSETMLYFFSKPILSTQCVRRSGNIRCEWAHQITKCQAVASRELDTWRRGRLQTGEEGRRAG